MIVTVTCSEIIFVTNGNRGAPKGTTLILQSLLFWQKSEDPPKKARIFLSAEPLKSLEKESKKRTKKQGKPQNEKSEENEKSKDWRVRVRSAFVRQMTRQGGT